jgi:hypothetical protein
MEIKMVTDKDRERAALYGCFLNYLMERIEDIKYKLMKLISFIEKDSYAQKHKEKFKKFYDDIYALLEYTNRLYDNLPDN